MTFPPRAEPRCGWRQCAHATCGEEDIPTDVINNERRIAEAAARAEGKPEQALAKIVEGRLNGFFRTPFCLTSPRSRTASETCKRSWMMAGVAVTRICSFRGGHRLRPPRATTPIASPPSPQ